MYVVLDEKGPDHEKCFEVGVELNGAQFSPCWGSSKKEAEQLAALSALVELEIAIIDDNGHVEIKDIQGE